jgi:hypothetical protein
MKTTPIWRHHHAVRGLRTGPGLAALLLAVAVGCGSVEEAPEPEEAAPQDQEISSTNSETPNGLAFNGLAFNGLAFNGLATNGLSSSEFSAWFQQNPTLADMVMRYVVTCAVPFGETRTYTDTTGRTYGWSGSLGLALDWASGQPATLKEQQIVSACLAAHVNKYGRSVTISVQGTNARGQPIPTLEGELKQFSQREGCFFGNLFTNGGVFVGNDGRLLGPNESSVRACALSQGYADGNACAPMVFVGSCSGICTLDPTRTYFTQCTYNGITYVPLTTRIRPQEVYRCGDGVCQLTESCGLGLSTTRCMQDCGTCQ